MYGLFIVGVWGKWLHKIWLHSLLHRNSRYKLIQGSPGGETGWTLIEQECEPLGDCDVIKESFLHGNQLFYDIPEKVETGLEYITVNASELMLFDLLGNFFYKKNNTKKPFKNSTIGPKWPKCLYDRNSKSRLLIILPHIS